MTSGLFIFMGFAGRNSRTFGGLMGTQLIFGPLLGSIFFVWASVTKLFGYL